VQRKLSLPERDIILAALRLYQEQDFIPQDIIEIAADSGTILDDDAIDELCEELNVGDLSWMVGAETDD
jgi:hypothetical protein